MPKRSISWVILLVVLLLTGCEGSPLGAGNVEELLRAPQNGITQSTIQKTLTSYLGEDIQLKYPRGGDEMAPMFLNDFDGDGTIEAAVLYTTKATGQNVRLAILEKEEDTWKVVCDTEGFSTEVASVERTKLLSTGMQLVIGYANANLSDGYLAAYQYKDQTLSIEYQQAYEVYYTGEFVTNGKTELLLIPPTTEPGAKVMHRIGEKSDKLEIMQSIPLDERFVSCNHISMTLYGSIHGVIIDGSLSTGGFASQVLRVQNGQFITKLPAPEEDIVRATTRYQQNLMATDLAGKGLVLAPQVVTGVSTLQHARRFYYVQWNNYLSELPEVQFGVFDAQYGYFLRLPQEWRGNIVISDSNFEDGWQIRMKEGNELLIAVRLLEREAPTGMYETILHMGDQKVALYLGENCTQEQKAFLYEGIVRLEQ